MIKTLYIPALVAAAVVLSGCASGLGPYPGGPDAVIATADDTGRDRGALIEGDAAIAYDPDGCQAWLIDDGIEGYSGRRFDPVTGLPICNGLYPPGTVLDNYQSQSPGLRDWIPGHRVTQ